MAVTKTALISNGKKGPGRPASDPKNPANRVLRVMVSDGQRAEIESEARAAGLSVSAWLRSAAREKLEAGK